VQQATTLSPADRTALEVSLARMTGDAFGALATLPLYCLGELPSPDPRVIILEHYEVWRSCLIVVREVLKADGGAPEIVQASLAALIDMTAELRDCYTQVNASYLTTPTSARTAYGRLVAAYERLPLLIRDLGVALELDTSFLPAPRSLKRTSYDRSLRAFGEAIVGLGQSTPAHEG
jgi:hypothetical protein